MKQSQTEDMAMDHLIIDTFSVKKEDGFCREKQFTALLKSQRVTKEIN